MHDVSSHSSRFLENESFIERRSPAFAQRCYFSPGKVDGEPPRPAPPSSGRSPPLFTVHCIPSARINPRHCGESLSEVAAVDNNDRCPDFKQRRDAPVACVTLWLRRTSVDPNPTGAAGAATSTFHALSVGSDTHRSLAAPPTRELGPGDHSLNGCRRWGCRYPSVWTLH